MFTLHTDCSCPELSNWYIFTRSIAESHGSIVPDLRIVEFFFTRMVAEVTVFSHEFSFCPELSNLRIGLFSHGASRKVTGFCHELSNYRISFHTDGRGGYEGGTIEA